MGERKDPELQLDALSSRVLDLVELIPPGRVSTYGDIAAQVNSNPRQIGKILATLGHLVPWWRVVRADGSSAVAARAQEHWAAENIPHRTAGDTWKVELRACRWELG
ncbi:Methylated-DNA--protein-cysteine methyltransferase [Corynebacterium occultum]|uniref:Methylated-DNA--protein-cysteine methyltransferase n=1 Tax=Corynebacterium occultum TaxID=2675219 RepID=A0A6B8W417_9CORY|nr:MGMT family protein [Corynebacterium occultum]QGU06155.1 Methylated-DNA--protein-cysteine methyltransferase [Corynebacterium occultum]